MPTLQEELTAAGVDPKVAEDLLKNPKVAERFEGSLRQSDYDRKMNAGKAELEAEKQRLAEQATQLTQARDRMNEQFTAAQRDREGAGLKVAALREKAKSLTNIYGIDFEKQLFEGETASSPVVQPQASATGNEAMKPILDRLAQLEDLFRTNVSFETQLHNIARQHDELFPDKPLDFEQLLSESVQQRRTPAQVWDDKFGATAKRQEMSAEKFREEGRKQAMADMEKKISAGNVNPLRPNAPTSPIFQFAGKREAGTPSDRSARRGQAISAAVDAFNSGKYAAAAPSGGNR
jgi:hypothetical protein